MAYVATNMDGFAPRASLFSRFFNRVGKAMVAYGEVRSHHAEIEKLSRLSNEELRARGLTRETIALQVIGHGYL